MTDRNIRRHILAHNIARQINDFASANWEIDQIIEMVQNEFEWSRRRSKSELQNEPIDKYGRIIEIPQENTQGISED